MIRRLTLASVGLLAALLIAVGGLGHRFWSGSFDGQRFGVGLRAVELCTQDGCQARPLRTLGTGGGTWEKLGLAAAAAGALAVASLLAVAIAAAMSWRRRARGIGTLAAGFCLVAFLLAGVFVMLAPNLGLSFSYGLALFMAGSAIGFGAAGVSMSAGQ